MISVSLVIGDKWDEEESVELESDEGWFAKRWRNCLYVCVEIR